MLIWHPCFAFPFPLSEVSVSKIKLEKERKRFSAIICCHNETHTKIRRKTRPRRAKQLLIHDCIHTHSKAVFVDSATHVFYSFFFVLTSSFWRCSFSFCFALSEAGLAGTVGFCRGFSTWFCSWFCIISLLQSSLKSSFTPAYQALLIINHYK